jgi:urease accessory protein
MIIITEIKRNLRSESVLKRQDLLWIDWYQADKRIQRLCTTEGMDIAVKLIGNTSQLHDGDILYEDAEKVVVIAIRPCEAICIETSDFLEIAFISCEIGNKHLPLFTEGNVLLIPFERTMLTWLDKQNISYKIASRQLLCRFNANVDANYHRQLKFSTKNIPLFIKA